MGRALVLLLAGWLALGLAWSVANPPFAAPDEHDHYVRALGVASGVWSGEPAPFRPASGLAAQAAWATQNARRVPVAEGLAPPAQCYVLDPLADAGCLEAAEATDERRLVTPVGSYQPAPYALSAALLGAAEGPLAAVRLGRLGILLPAFALLALGVVALGHGTRSPLWLIGPILAVTPTAVTSMAALNPSGWEVAAGIGFGAALLRALRPGEPAPAWVWSTVGLTGVALALSKTSGVPWLIAIGLLALAASRRPPTLGRAGAAAVAAIVAAAALNRLWEQSRGPHMTVSLANPRAALEGGFEQWGRAAEELVAAFGYLEVSAPWWLAGPWALLVVAAAAAAARVQRPPLGLVAAVVASVVGPPLLYVLVIRHTGFGLQGRHVLPVLAMLPLIAGELLGRGGGDRRLLVAAAAGAALVQVAAWWLYARRSAVGVDGSWWFVPDAAWTPPGGYALWILVVTAGAGAVATSGVIAARRPGRGAT